MDEQLWSKYDVAKELDISVKGADNWLRRNRVPVAGRSNPVRGGSTNLYRATEVLAKRASSPGRGNRTPRPRRFALKPQHREILERMAELIEKHGHEDAYLQPVRTPEYSSQCSTYTITAMQRRGLVARETITSFLSMGERNGRENMSVAFMTATGRKALDTGCYPEIPEDGPGDERVILVRQALEGAKRDGSIPPGAVITINSHGFTSMINVHVEIEGGWHIPRETAAPLARTLYDLIGHRRKVEVALNYQAVEQILPT